MKALQVVQSLKAQAGKVIFGELYTLALLSFALPYLVYLYLSWREALVAFVLIQITLGLLNLREAK